MDALVGVLIGMFALYAGIRRMSYVSAMFKRREKLERLEKALRDARDNASGPSPWRVAGEKDRDIVALLAAALADERSLEALGFQRLGDLVGQLPGKPATFAMRVLVKDTVVAGLMVTRSAPTTVRISLSSEPARTGRASCRRSYRTRRCGAGRSALDVLSASTPPSRLKAWRSSGWTT